jgi:hypothetical protein
MNPSFFGVLDGIDPSDNSKKPPQIRAPVIELKRDQFLKYDLLFIQGKYFDVQDLILHCANVLGGVHVGEPKNSEEEQLSALQSFRSGGLPVNLRQIQPVHRVVLDALSPLRSAVQKEQGI